MTVSPPNETVWHRSELKRMRLLAGGLLVVMLALFGVTSAMETAWPWLAYPRAFAESAMVGACADWFAVVALFRHPLGLPIPHTAIVPRQQKRIGESLGLFIANNFLSPAVVTARLERIDAADWAARWLKKPDNAKSAAATLQGLLPPLRDRLGGDHIRSGICNLIRNLTDSMQAGPTAARMLSVLVANGYHDTLFYLAIDLAEAFLNGHGDGIRQKVTKCSPRWIPGWIDDTVTDAFLTEFRESLEAARAASHPWRTDYHEAIDRFRIRLAEDPGLRDQCERVKADLVNHTVTGGGIDWLAREVETALTAPGGILSEGLERALLAGANYLDNDPHIRAMINHWARKLVLSTVIPNRAEIGAFIGEVVARWDTATLVDKLELQVGKDLQYIRINGTLVGGLAGLIIFTVARLFH